MSILDSDVYFIFLRTTVPIRPNLIQTNFAGNGVLGRRYSFFDFLNSLSERTIGKKKKKNYQVLKNAISSKFVISPLRNFVEMYTPDL